MASIRPLHVLLVDDDPGIQAAVALGLQVKGFEVVVAGTGAEALRIAQDPTVPIDVIVIDIMLPDVWGARVAMERTLFRPDAKVVFISGYSRTDPILQASVDDVPFLSKPFSVDELSDLIHRVVGEPAEQM